MQEVYVKGVKAKMANDRKGRKGNPRIDIIYYKRLYLGKNTRFTVVASPQTFLSLDGLRKPTGGGFIECKWVIKLHEIRKNIS